MKRIQYDAVKADLQKKITLIVGPRQAGKTWLSKSIGQTIESTVYLNYDQAAHRKIIKNQSWLPTTQLLILDELHKLPDWKNYIKGLYDTKPENMKIIVTGSARLDIMNHLGDALAGRYYKHRLLPFSLAELKQLNTPSNIETLITRSGFPEPLFAQNDLEAERWRLQYVDSILTTDVFDIEIVKNLKALHLVFDLLRQRAGSPISYQSIAEDVNVSLNTVKKYIQILEALYIIFRITPYSKNIARSLLKEPKIYFFDTALVRGDNGAKLENLVAVSLLKHSCALEDYQAKPYSLHYLRTKDGKEVDFALALNKEITEMIEVKFSNDKLSPSLLYFHKKYQIPAVQLVQHLQTEQIKQNCKILNAQTYLENLYL